MKEIHPKILKKLSDLEQDALIDLWTIRKDNYVLRVCHYANEKNQPVVFAGEQYAIYPVEMSGVDITGKGASNRPTLSLSNILGSITALAEEYNDGVGAIVARRQVYKQHLDPVNFEGGNPQADKQAAILSQWVIERMTHLDDAVANFELASPAETDGVKIPSKTINSKFPNLIFP